MMKEGLGRRMEGGGRREEGSRKELKNINGNREEN